MQKTRAFMHIDTLYLKFRLFHRSAIFGIARDKVSCHLDLPFAQTPCVHAMDASRRMVIVKSDLVDVITFRDAMHRLDEHVEVIFHHGDEQWIGFLTGMAIHDRM